VRRWTFVLAVLACLAAAAAPAAAADAPWQAGSEVREHLFDAQAAVLLDEGDAGRDVAAAARAYAGPLRAGLKADAPEAHRAVLDGLAAARKARSPLELAAARGTV